MTLEQLEELVTVMEAGLVPHLNEGGHDLCIYIGLKLALEIIKRDGAKRNE